MNTTRHISIIERVDQPEAGGRYAVSCMHKDVDGTVIGIAVLQNNDKQLLGAKRMHTEDWCCYCQQENN